MHTSIPVEISLRENMDYFRSSAFLVISCCIVFLNLITTSLPSGTEAEHETPPFTYLEGTGKGPSKWGFLNPDWKACGIGKLQSPIDLSTGRAQISPNLGELKTDYKPAPAVIINRGHDITVFWKGDAGAIVINEIQYNLVGCHWHSPTEHSFDGSRHQLELHVVHKSAQGQIAVIGMLYKDGIPDHFLEKLLPHIKAVKKEEKDLGVVNPGIINFRIRKYFRYIGSLTTPPCTEGVVWTVVQEVRTASSEQIRALREAVDDGFEANARPTQQGNGRPIYLYTPWD